MTKTLAGRCILFLLTCMTCLGPGPVALAAATDSSWLLIRQRGFLRVAADPLVGAPYFFRSDDRYAGFEWDVLDALTLTLGVRIEIVEVPWPEQLAALVSQKVDLIFNGRELPVDTRNDGTGNLRLLLATRPYYISAQHLVVVESRRPLPRRLGDLGGLRVGAIPGSGGWALLTAYNAARGNTVRLAGFGTVNRLMAQLEGSRLDAVVVDAPVATWQVRQRPRLRLVGSPLLPIPLVGLVRVQDGSIREQLDLAIAHLLRSGRLRAILDRWHLWNGFQAGMKAAPARLCTGNLSAC